MVSLVKVGPWDDLPNAMYTNNIITDKNNVHNITTIKNRNNTNLELFESTLYSDTFRFWSCHRRDKSTGWTIGVPWERA